MNGKRRDFLRKAIRYIDSSYDLVATAIDEEENCLDNIPENLQASDRYAEMEEAAEHLQDAFSLLEDAREKIALAIGG